MDELDQPDQPGEPNRPGTSRAQRRRDTEGRILTAARAIFAEKGFERTTIRAVAAAARVDPALVMQYFGSKQELFSRSVRVPVDRPLTEDPQQLLELLLVTLGVKIGELPETSLAMLRSMLTHPEAARTARTTLERQIEQIAVAVPGPDARLRAALAIATTLGLTIGRHLLELDPLRAATPERIVELLRPGYQALISGRD